MSQKILFESSGFIVFIGLIAAFAYAWGLYQLRHSWSKQINYLLAAFRFAVVLLIMILLAGPILKLIQNAYEKPIIVFAIDNSQSISEVVDAISLNRYTSNLSRLADKLSDNGYTSFFKYFDEDENQFRHPSSNLQGLLKSIQNEYEGRNLKGTVLVSDGIYNQGISPLYTSYTFPIYTLGIGDTTQKADVAIRNILYNKISYQGNRFPVKVEVLVSGYVNRPIQVGIYQSGKLISSQQQNSGNKTLLEFDFSLDADIEGLRQYSVRVAEMPDEANTRNNARNIFIEVVEGKKKVLVIAAAPHPDIKALRNVIESNSNYEFLIHIPDVTELPSSQLQPNAIDLVIFHHIPHRNNRGASLYQNFLRSNTPRLLLMGLQTNNSLLSTDSWPLSFEARMQQWDEVSPVVNTAFGQFNFSQEISRTFRSYPPVTVPFAKLNVSPNATVLLWQRVGSVETDRPLLLVNNEGVRSAVMVGDGIWRWPLHEQLRNDNSNHFNELFGKLIQFLSSQDDKRKFRFYPLQNEFTDTGPAIFESEVYNDLYERVYGNNIQLSIQNEAGQRWNYEYTTSPGLTQYQVSDLQEGIYKYAARTTLSGKTENAQGEFSVIAQNIEQQNLVADFDLLRRLAGTTGAQFYNIENIEQLEARLLQTEAKPLIRAEENFLPLINLQWILLLILLLISAEWFLRKFYGSY